MTRLRTKRRIRIGNHFYAFLGVASVAAASGGIWGVSRWCVTSAIETANAKLEKGFGTLAAEILEPHRKRLVTEERGCRALLAAYFSARQADKLEWASQSCLDAKIEIVDSYLGLAASYEFKGRDGDAIQVLVQAEPKFEKLADVNYRLAGLYKRANRNIEAAAAYRKATERAPQVHAISLEALAHYSKQNLWTDAAAMADRLKGVETEDPEVKLMIARAFARVNNLVAADVALGEAVQLLAKTPEKIEALEKAYPDVLIRKPSGIQAMEKSQSVPSRSVASPSNRRD